MFYVRATRAQSVRQIPRTVATVRIHGEAVVDVGSNQILAAEPRFSGDQLPELIAVDRFHLSYTRFKHSVDTAVPICIQDLARGFTDEAETEPHRWYEERADVYGCDGGHSE